MIWRSSFNSVIAQIADFFTVFFGLGISYFVWDYLFLRSPGTFPQPFELNLQLVTWGLVISLFYVIILKKYEAYSYQRFTSLLKEFINILKASFIIVLGAIIVSYFMYFRIPRTTIIISFIFVILLMILEKSLLYLAANFIRQKGKNRKKIIIVGDGERAKEFIDVVKKNFSWGLDIIGVLTGEKDKIEGNFYGYKIINTYDNIVDIVKEYNPEEIVIAISSKNFADIRKILEITESVGIQVRLYSDFLSKFTKNIRIDNVYGINIISIGYTDQKEWQLFIKRLIDIIVSLISLIVLTPLFIVISIIIFLQDGRPIFYKWKIVGYNRKPITSWKFRTMVKNADEIKKQLMKENEMRGPVFKLTNDPRILPIGRFLRKYSLDELPQLFSVLKGDLSLVGPRPPLQYEFKEFDLWHRRKLSVKPGLTCLWQISGRSEITDFDEWAKLDLEYIDNWSLLLDLKILIKTIPVVLFGKGAK